MLDELLKALASTPKLPDAACKSKSKWPVFDAALKGGTAQTEAISICRSCPALSACRRWAKSLDGLPPYQGGLVAGTVVAAKVIRPAKTEPMSHDQQVEALAEAHYQQWLRRHRKPA